MAMVLDYYMNQIWFVFVAHVSALFGVINIIQYTRTQRWQ